jgi:ribosomal protein S18 acetylase RimI-like enzyme
VVVRAASREDLPALLRLYRELHADDPVVDEETAEVVWAQMQAQPGRVVLVADDGAEVVGTVDTYVVANLTRGARPILFVENVIVSAGHRRGGVGRRLLDAALEIARSAGCYKIQLLSAAGPPAPAFYEANGFRAIARGYRRYL